MQVIYPTTPAQMYHALRRQVVRRWRKPLIVMTPKSLLRHPKVVSPLELFTEGIFQRILPDTREKPKTTKRILLCSGKVYYDLEARREEAGRDDVAILRFEQLYPLADETIAAALAPYKEGTPVVWVQEEPENMGAWRFIRCMYGDFIQQRHPMTGVYRHASASPATGSASSHKLEQKNLIDEAFAGLE